MNEPAEINFIIDNDAAIDDDGWGLLAPFGEHPKTRTVKREGKIVEENFLQIVDNEAVDRLVGKENSFFRKLMRAVVGIPIYNRGHPDLKEHAPEVIGNAKSEKIHLGVIDKVRKTARGLEAHFVLNNEGADAVEKKGWKFPSALWQVECVGERDGKILARPYKLLSACLTPRPNIGAVESLANEFEIERAAKEAGNNAANARQTVRNKMLREQILGALVGMGIAIENEATDQQIVAALIKFKTAVDNGDYVGHIFHGNQYVEGGANTHASKASKAAHEASNAADSQAEHKTAEKLHRQAATEQAAKGHTNTAQYHLQMAEMHKSIAEAPPKQGVTRS